jgi:predicted ArsR family transcriptional regulator
MRVHRALADPTRATVYQVLRAGGKQFCVSELADGLGVHPNTVRSHLQVLEDAGLVTSVAERRDRPGRPRRLFDAVRDAADDEHRLLASALAEALEPLDGGTALAEEAGRHAGRRLVRTADLTLTSPSLDRVVALLDDRGFDATAEDGEIVMQRCPFGDVAEEHPKIVCAFHAGLIDGALDEAGSEASLVSLDPWARTDACVARLR